MNKKGFTLVELLVVIAIISILAVLVVPSILNVNKNANKRLLDQKKEYILSAAELYGSNHPDIFVGNDTVHVYVDELIKSGYLKPDKDSCTCVNNENVDCLSGCVINPIDNSVMNDEYVILTRKPSGLTAEFDSSNTISLSSEDGLLINKVCALIGEGDNNVIGKYGENENDICTCEVKDGTITLKKLNGDLLGDGDMCLLVNKSGGDINNYLKYGADHANWRVLGLYGIEGKFIAKMITNSVVN